MIVWTRAVLGVLYSCVSYFCIHTYSTQLSKFHMERCSSNTIITISITTASLHGNDTIANKRPLTVRYGPEIVVRNATTHDKIPLG